MGQRFPRKMVLIVAGVVVALVAVLGGGLLLRSSATAANSKTQCLANQRLIDAAAGEYLKADSTHTKAQIEGAVNESNPLVTSALGGKAQFLVVAPRCPDRQNEPYILRDGSTDCPVHGTYQ